MIYSNLLEGGEEIMAGNKNSGRHKGSSNKNRGSGKSGFTDETNMGIYDDTEM